MMNNLEVHDEKW